MTFQDKRIGMVKIRNRDSIFGLYQRFHEHSEGKGIGLYLIRSQVEALGGSIGLESEVDKGMSVLLRFKKKEATPHSLVQDDTAHHPSDLQADRCSRRGRSGHPGYATAHHATAPPDAPLLHHSSPASAGALTTA